MNFPNNDEQFIFRSCRPRKEKDGEKGREKGTRVRNEKRRLYLRRSKNQREIVESNAEDQTRN